MERAVALSWGGCRGAGVGAGVGADVGAGRWGVACELIAGEVPRFSALRGGVAVVGLVARADGGQELLMEVGR